MWGTLYSLKYPEIENVSPESWKARLHEAIRLILADLCKKAPAIICVEDLHWADSSSVELLRNILSDFRHPALFLCIYRPTFSLFTSHQMNLIKSYQEIRLQDLSPTDAQSMVESLLRTEAVPGELKRFIRDKVEGNPFYLEEVINSLLETETLIHKDDKWTLTKSIAEANIPSTVQGVISARLDRLEMETKRILQEASVIGRAFFYEILKRITELKEQIDRSLAGLERLDLIRTRSLQPDLEYIFKHALTQEVVYNGLLKKERQNIHEKIGQVMEELFKDRLQEFYEALAYHFKQGHSTLKAVGYLMKAGEKSFNRYALDEAHQYYKEAFGLLSEKADKSIEDKSLLVDILLQWSQVYYRRSLYVELSKILEDYEELASSLDDKARLGMFYVRQGGALVCRQKLREAHQYLQKALHIGTEIKDQRIIGYSCGFLTWCCADLGMLGKAVEFGKITEELNLHNTSDQDLFRYPSWALGYAYWQRGEVRKVKDTANAILEYAQKNSNMACMSDGNLMMALGHSAAGDFISAIEYAQKAVHFALEPMLLVGSKTVLGMSLVANGQYVKAENVLKEAEIIADNSGYEYANEPNRLFSGVVMVTKGNLSLGINRMEEVVQTILKKESRWRYAFFNHVLGQVYLQMVQGEGEKSISFIAKNIGFLIKTIPFAHRKAEGHLIKAIETAKEIGAKSILGQASLDMGRLRQAKGRTDEARKYMSEAIRLFEECEADVFLKQAREAFAALG